MIIAGLDPGTQRAGFAVVEEIHGKLHVKDLGVWNLIQGRPALGERLEMLHAQVKEFFTKWNPPIIGFEKAVSFRNIASAHTLAEARGVIRLAAHQVLSRAEDRFVELSPTAVKKQVAGWGGSSKELIVKSLHLRFAGLEAIVHDRNFNFDAFDALAIAYTAWLSRRTQLRKLGVGRERSPDFK